MEYLSPTERGLRRRRRLVRVAIVAALALILTLLDRPLLFLLIDQDRSVEGNDWYRMLRIAGYLGTWLIVGAAFVLIDAAWRRGSLIFLAAVLSGLAAEILKLVVVRERPVDGSEIQNDGWYTFRPPFSGFADGGNLGFPSSHTAVAFGGLCMLALLFPRAKYLFVAVAIGTGITRMLTGAHFATDVLGGAICGWLIAGRLARWADIKPPGSGPVRFDGRLG